MTLDIRGSLKNTRINQTHYAVIDELLSNAIDSFLIRCIESGVKDDFDVEFVIEFFSEQLLDNTLNIKITCTDNGAGFDEKRTKAFVTKDTSYKDDLGIEGIGRCKGSGRIQFLHFFKKLEIDSVYLDSLSLKRKVLLINENSKEVNEDSFENQDVNNAEYHTKITLQSIKPDVLRSIFKGSELIDIFSVGSLKQHVLVSFLQRFVSLKDNLGNFKITFSSFGKDLNQQAELQPSDIPNFTKQETIEVLYDDSYGHENSKTEHFLITHYKLSKDDFSLDQNTVALCAKSSIVKNITSKYLKSKTLVNNDIGGFYHIVLIESEYLDNLVNEQRDDFSMPKLIEDKGLLSGLLSLEEIYNQIETPIIEMLSPPDWDKEKIVRNIETKFGMSSSMIHDTKVRVRFGDTEESVVKRVLTVYQDDIIQDTSEIFDMKEEIAESDPNADDYREKVNKLAWKYTSSLKKIDMVNLSQLVVRRAAVLEILKLAIARNLGIQNAEGRKNNESIIHQIFFPMRMDSDSTDDHDIWILNEEYQYYSYIASDKSLANIPWEGEELLFDSSIDSELAKLLNKNYENNSAKRPDIAIFSKEGAVIIVEFKAPGVSMDDHVGDIQEYATLLCSKSKGRLKKVYGYLIGTDLNSNRIQGYERFPNGKGWFTTTKIMEHDTDTKLGELYSEILYYPDIVDRAEKRLEVYKKKLNLSFN